MEILVNNVSIAIATEINAHIRAIIYEANTNLYCIHQRPSRQNQYLIGKIRKFYQGFPAFDEYEVVIQPDGFPSLIDYRLYID